MAGGSNQSWRQLERGVGGPGDRWTDRRRDGSGGHFSKFCARPPARRCRKTGAGNDLIPLCLWNIKTAARWSAAAALYAGRKRQIDLWARAVRERRLFAHRGPFVGPLRPSAEKMAKQ